jgi:hypothetical protein
LNAWHLIKHLQGFEPGTYHLRRRRDDDDRRDRVPRYG